MQSLRQMSDINLANQRVLIREDFNVPLENGQVSSDSRLLAALPTIQHAWQQGAAVILLSHLGRPRAGQFEPAFSLAPVAVRLTELLGQPVTLLANWLGGVEVKPGQVVLCENVRFNVGETQNDERLAKQMAALADVFVMDAFATAHRAEASTYGVARYAPIACAGPLLLAEIKALQQALAEPARPLTAIVGGAKVSTKLAVLENLANVADRLIVGGGIANTFMAAAGLPIGKSLYEPGLVDQARYLMELMQARGAEIPLPVDVVTANHFAYDATARIKPALAVTPDEMILDIGPKTAQQFKELLQQSQTILWNGPVGVFEWEPFAQGTQQLANAIANSEAFTIAGGGDTLAAIEKYAITDKISYISTGGGAFLEFVEGKTLPAIAILQERFNQ